MRSIRLSASVFALTLIAVTGLTGCVNGAGDGTVTVLGIWTGAEEAEFRQVLNRFEERTGVEVIYTGARDASNVLGSDLQQGNPPDLAILQTPYELTAYAQEHLVPLDQVLEPELIEQDYGEQWQALTRAGTDSYYAVVVKAALKSMVWYYPAALANAGHTPPTSWPQLRRLSEQIRDQDRAAPWCLGVESSPSSGWPGTDWIEDILLHQSGPDAYQAWADGELAWTSTQVRRAWRTWGDLIAEPGAVHGGAHAALVTHFSQAGRPLFNQPPGCYLHHGASFMRGAYEGYQLTGAVSFLPFPAIEPEYAGSHVVAADLMVMFRDTGPARQLINFLATAEAQQIWPSLGTGAISASSAVPPLVYRDEAIRRSAELITDPEAQVYFDASDLMPISVREAFNQGVLRFLAAPAELDTILADLERVRVQAREQAS